MCTLKSKKLKKFLEKQKMTYHPSSVPSHIVGPCKSSLGAWLWLLSVVPSPAAGAEASFGDFLRCCSGPDDDEDEDEAVVACSPEIPLLLAPVTDEAPVVAVGPFVLWALFAVPSVDSLSLESLKLET